MPLHLEKSMLVGGGKSGFWPNLAEMVLMLDMSLPSFETVSPALLAFMMCSRLK